MPGRNNTTLPGSMARSTLRENGLLAIRWLFPATSGPLASIAGERIVIGRGDDCGTVLPGSEISRYHAELVRHGPVVGLRDLGSMNGSFVNGRRIEEMAIEPGDVIRLGEWIGVAVDVASAELALPAQGPIGPGLLGGDKLRDALAPALKAAASDLPIVVEGETGTGKEVVARAIHALSGRAGGFLAVNCAALPDNLAEAELFGYRRGAFTGADRASPGHFRAADGGTLLLDEIIDLPLALQAKVLRVLEQREVVPLGESQPVPIDVRVIVAAQESLEGAVADKRFRADLYARIEGVTVQLPPLRARVDDVPFLFARFLNEFSGGRAPAVDPRLVEQLCLYDWPLNVRELVTLVRRILVLHGHEPGLRARHLPARFRTTDAAASAGPSPRRDPRAGRTPAAPESVAGVERDDDELTRLLAALRLHGGNVSRAAGAIGISRQRAYRLIQAHPDVDLDGLRATDSGRGRGGAR